MTRIIVKNLPKHLKEDRFRDHFSKQGHVTDVKLMKASDGTSRKFGYIGFKTDKEAKAAVRFFNNTFIDTSKIIVELAKQVNDPSLPRPWSKYSQDKKQQEEMVKQKQEERLKEELMNKNKKQGSHIKLLSQANDDSKLKEYLEIMQPRGLSKTWANDDTAVLKNDIRSETGARVKVQVSSVPSKKTGGQGVLLTKTHLKFEDEDLYEDLPQKNDEEVDEIPEISEEEQKKSLAFNSSISDLDYLKSKMKPALETPEQGVVENTNNGSTLTPEEKSAKETIPDNSESSNPKPAPTVPEASPESQILDNGRLFVRNLPYTCTEDELKKAFEKVGPLAELHMPISRDTKKPKGFAYILYVLPEHAVTAYKKMDNSFFQGRLLHILPSKDKLTTEIDLNDPTLSFKKRAELKKKANSTSEHNWNSLFMSSDAIADAISARLGISKSEVLDPTADNVATRLAMAETQIIIETKQFFEDHGILLGSFGRKERSDTVILVKNIPYGTTEKQIRELFEPHGDLGRVLIPPSQTIAVVEFLAPAEARAAFRHLAYKRFGDAPLYLEKAPTDIFKETYDPSIHKATSSDQFRKALDDSSDKEDSTDKATLMDKITSANSDQSESTTLFIKNLNFETTQDKLKEAFQNLPGLKSVVIKTKPDAKNPGKTLSMGFGFVEFDSKDNAAKAMAAMQGFDLEGHSLLIKVSNRGSEPGSANQVKQATKGTKLLVKNIPFEATKKDIRELFSAFGQIKTLRLPSKFSGGHRGFCFVEFLTSREAKTVMENVANTHLYGRHLVLQYAEDESSIESMREKVSKQFAKDQPLAKKRRVELPEDDEEEF